MVRTECSECAQTTDKSTGAGCALLNTYNDKVWAWHDSASWARDGKFAIAPTLCPGFEPQSNNGQTNPTTPAPAPVATDTISVTPRNRSEEGNSQAILDSSECAAGPWRTDVENAPEGVYLLFYCEGCTTPFCGMRWKENTWSGANRCTCNGGGGINEFPDSEIARFAVIGGE